MNKTDHQTSSDNELNILKAKYKQMELRATLAEQLINASIDCVVAMDLQGNVLHWNEMCNHFSGIGQKEITGKPFSSFFPAMANNKAVVAGIQQVKLGHKVFIPAEQDAWFRGYFELHLVPLKDALGTVNGLLLIAHDVAHRVKAELELKALNHKLEEKYTQLEQANAELANFTHLTSHDLKAPLRKIYSSLEKTIMDEGGKISIKGRGTIRKVQSSVQRLGLLADSLTTFSELRHELEEQVSLNAVVQDAINQLSPQIQEHQAHIEVADLPPIEGNAGALKMLFFQLLSNAIKFHRPGIKPEIAIYAAVDLLDNASTPLRLQQQKYWCIKVQDNGIGIAPEDHERIFDLFEKGRHDGLYSGAGLGLALAKKIAGNHGGFVTVSQATDGGSMFNCYFPFSKEPA